SVTDLLPAIQSDFKIAATLRDVGERLTKKSIGRETPHRLPDVRLCLVQPANGAQYFDRFMRFIHEPRQAYFCLIPFDRGFDQTASPRRMTRHDERVAEFSRQQAFFLAAHLTQFPHHRALLAPVAIPTPDHRISIASFIVRATPPES